MRYWGKTTYGTWLALSAAYTILRTVDGGFTAFVGNKLNMLYHQDQDEMRRVLSSAIWGVILLGSTQIIIVLALYFSNSLGLIMGGAASQLTANQTIFGLMVMSITWILTGSYIGVLHRFLIPNGMLYQLLWWVMLLQVSQSLSIMLAAYLQLSVFNAALFFAFAQAAVYICSAFYIKWRLPQFYPWLSGAKLKIGLREMVQSFPMTINGAVQQAGNSGVVILISVVLGAAVIPIYSTMRTLSNLWTTVTNIVTAPLLPDIVRFHATKEPRKFIMIHKTHILLMSIIINLSIMLAYPLIDTVYLYWTRGKLPIDHRLICLLLASVSVFALNSLFNTFLTGLNNGRYLIVMGLMRGLFVLIAGYFLLPIFGLSGIGMAILLAEVLLMVANTFIFIRGELKSIGAKRELMFTWYDGLCFLSVLGFLLLNVFITNLNMMYYLISLIVLLIGIIYSWVNLDIEIRSRILRMFKIIR
ncbi:MAG: hypothetical protein KBD37_01310 [Burkholderiales bacterium]|nr:hypothetical protein [Burkholderiales bacterium]